MAFPAFLVLDLGRTPTFKGGVYGGSGTIGLVLLAYKTFLVRVKSVGSAQQVVRYLENLANLG